MCPPLEMKDLYGDSYIKGGTFIVVITVFWQKQREEVDKVTCTNLQSYLNIFNRFVEYHFNKVCHNLILLIGNI